jgi:hypothetical protein
MRYFLACLLGLPVAVFAQTAPDARGEGRLLSEAELLRKEDAGLPQETKFIESHRPPTAESAIASSGGGPSEAGTPRPVPARGERAPLPPPPKELSPRESAALAVNVSVSRPDATGVTITAEQWARPRSGRTVAAFPGLAGLVAQLESAPDKHLALRFAPGDEAVLWAEELRAWLVALGLPSARLALEPGSPDADRLMLELRSPR